MRLIIVNNVINSVRVVIYLSSSFKNRKYVWIILKESHGCSSCLWIYLVINRHGLCMVVISEVRVLHKFHIVVLIYCMLGASKFVFDVINEFEYDI